MKDRRPPIALTPDKERFFDTYHLTVWPEEEVHGGVFGSARRMHGGAAEPRTPKTPQKDDWFRFFK